MDALRRKPIQKRIGIVTLISNNFGNRLQNYALQEFLRKQGFKVYTIPYETTFIKIIRRYIKKVLCFLFKRFRQRYSWDYFNFKKISWANPFFSSAHLNNKYDNFIAGSDQIWNPLFPENSEREFLTAYDKEKRLAYAASIGIDKLPDSCLEQFKAYFNGIPSISVREDRAADIILELTGRQVPVVLDPTLLLTRSEWQKIIASCRIKVPKRYIVKYILGTKSHDYEEYIKDKANNYNLEIIDLLNCNVNGTQNISPLDFVYCIANSEGTYVDSFHGTVFSILFSKPFVVFERPYEEGTGLMSSRLDTLLKTFGMEDRRVKNREQLEGLESSCDFSRVEKILLTRRSEASDYLRNALRVDKWADKHMEKKHENRTCEKFG